MKLRFPFGQKLLTICLAGVGTVSVLGGHQTNQFVRVQGTHMMAGNQRFYYCGANCFYLPMFAQDTNMATEAQTWRDMADEVLNRCAAWDLKVVRVFAFNEENVQEFIAPYDDWRFQTSPGVYREQALVGLDYVLSRANDLNLFLVLVFVNNWSAYGGMNWYVTNSPTASGNHDEFYTDLWCRQWFKDHVRVLVNRTNSINHRIYRDDPTIFAWQLANEPRSADPTALTNWVYEMAGYVKSIDTNHMLSTGEEGWEPTWSCNNACPSVDYAVIHCWPDHWWFGPEPEVFSNAMDWVSNHIVQAESVLGKPLVLSEYGLLRPPFGPPLDAAYGRDAYHEGWFNVMYSSAVTDGAVVGMHFWMIEADNSGHGQLYGDGIFSWDTTSVAIIRRHARMMNRLISPAITDIASEPSGVCLRWTEVVGGPAYRVEVSEDLIDWASLSLAHTNSWTDQATQSTDRRFYRIIPEY